MGIGAALCGGLDRIRLSAGKRQAEQERSTDPRHGGVRMTEPCARSPCVVLTLYGDGNTASQALWQAAITSAQGVAPTFFDKPVGEAVCSLARTATDWRISLL